MIVYQILLHILGIEPRQTSTAYNFWSGFGSDIAEFAILIAAWRLVNCHEPGCWRIGTKVTVEENGHHYRRCAKCHRKRHPLFFDQTPPPSAQQPPQGEHP